MRIRSEGRSFPRGTPPAWLAAAAEFQVLPLEEGSTVLPLRARPLAAAAPEQFAQGHLVDSISDRSCLGLFEESLEVALQGDEESELFDQALLKRFQRFSRFLDGEIHTVEISSEEPGSSKPFQTIKVEPETLEIIGGLIRKTPPPQRTRLVGKLDMIRHHDQMFSLQLESGQTVKGVADSTAAEELPKLWGHEVVIQGTATFRPSGSVLRIEADVIEKSTGPTSPWSKMPTPVFRSLDTRALRVEQGPRSGLNAIYDRWPGDESDDEVADALAKIS